MNKLNDNSQGNLDDNTNANTDDPEVWWKLNKQNVYDHDETNAAIPNRSQQLEERIEHKRLSFWSHFKLQLYIAIILFISFVFLQNIDEEKPLKLMTWLETAIHDDIPFTEIAVWYNNTFSGSPSFIPAFDNKSQQVISKKSNETLSLPVPDGLIVRSFADSLTGLELSTPQGASVLAVDEGRVVFVREEGDTVIIQHSNKYVSIYSKLAMTSVELNQWVKAGDQIGSMSQVQQKPLLFYAIKKENQYVDPLGVISFD